MYFGYDFKRRTIFFLFAVTLTLIFSKFIYYNYMKMLASFHCRLYNEYCCETKRRLFSNLRKLKGG